jgi:4-diphosphocytidyl-2-C-methyl-D-erythritol kinase
MGVTVFSPAKINLFLAITGKRADGFHELVSVAATLDVADELSGEERIGKTERGAGRTENGRFSLVCDDPTLPVDGSNLVLKAAEAFAVAANWPGAVNFRLRKRIPIGAGLGGGSSNAVAALRVLNEISGRKLTEAKLAELAATLGSDCALFLQSKPVVMRGRGEQIVPLPSPASDRLRGRRVLIFKPNFAVATAWAYAQMARRGTDYLRREEAEERLAIWVDNDHAGAAELLFNNMQAPVFDKYVALPVLLGKLHRDFGVAVQMSGSGSACFALLDDEFVADSMVACIYRDWGPRTFVREARIS